MEPPRFRTSRLGFRQICSADYGVIRLLYSSADASRFLPPLDCSHQNILKRIATFKALYARDERFGVWMAHRIEDGARVGFFQLRPIEEAPEHVEVGYRLLPQWWGRGYATEGAAYLTARGLDEYELPRVVARTHPDNAASIRVLEKIGFAPCAALELPPSDFPLVWFDRFRTTPQPHAVALGARSADRCDGASKTDAL